MHALKTEIYWKKIAEHHFNPFRVEQRAFTLGKALGFPDCTDQNKAYLFSKPYCGMHNTTWNYQRGIWQSGIWIPLTTSSCEGMWPRAAPAITMTESVCKGNMEISALNFFFYFLVAYCQCKLDLNFWIWCINSTEKNGKESVYWQSKLNHDERQEWEQPGLTAQACSLSFFIGQHPQTQSSPIANGLEAGEQHSGYSCPPQMWIASHQTPRSVNFKKPSSQGMVTASLPSFFSKYLLF